MHRSLALLLLMSLGPPCVSAGQIDPSIYGSDPAAGHTFTHDGVELYYEIHGSGGVPLLVVHGNGGQIHDLAAQIEHFSQSRTVIAMDSRDQGRSGDSTGPLTYEKMADDLAALVDQVGLGPVDVLGWSDGGIEALLLGLRHPDKVHRLVAMAANLNPEGAHPEVIAWLKDYQPAPSSAHTPAGGREQKVAALMSTEPQIPPEALAGIRAPTLVMAGDRDMIADEHTLLIYHHLPNAELAIGPNQTHFWPYDDPDSFDAIAERFLDTPYVKRERMPETMKSLSRMRAGE